MAPSYEQMAMHFNIYTLDPVHPEESPIKGLLLIERMLHEHATEINGTAHNITSQQTTKFLTPFMTDNHEKDAAWTVAPGAIREAVNDFLLERHTIDAMPSKRYKAFGAQAIADNERALFTKLDAAMQNPALNEDERKAVSDRVKTAAITSAPSNSYPLPSR